MKVVVISIIAAGLSFHHSHCAVCDSCSTELDESAYNVHYRDGNKHKHKKHSSGNKLTDTPAKPHESLRLRKKKKYDCDCDCHICYNLQQCCRDVCDDECYRVDDNSVESEETGQAPGNLVFVPYPYPLVVPPPIPPMPMLPGPPITTTTTQSTTNEIYYNRRSNLDGEVLDLLRSLKRIEDSRAITRPVRGRRIPEYEQLDDELLDQLIRQRQVKDINSG